MTPRTSLLTPRFRTARRRKAPFRTLTPSRLTTPPKQPRGEFYAHLDYLKKDEYSLEFIDNSIPQFRTEIDGWVNANFGYRSDNGWAVQVWGKNLTDELVVLYGQDFWFSLYGASLGTNEELFNASFGPRYMEPRTYGVSVSYEF